MRKIHFAFLSAYFYQKKYFISQLQDNDRLCRLWRFYSIISLFFTSAVYSQSYIYSGTISTPDSNPIPPTEINIFKQDSLIYSTLSESSGYFSMSLKKGNYTLKINEYNFYKPISINSDINETIIIKPQKAKKETNLETVQVIGTKPIYSLELDKKVYDVTQDIAAKGNSLGDVINNVPLLAMDADGTVTIRGNSNIKILVDGKPSGMVGISSNDALRNIPADLVEKIEVMTNPSSAYEAEGSGGIINIITKKGKKSGLNGSVEAFVGDPINAGMNVNISDKRDKWNWFFNTGVSYSEPRGMSSVYLENFDVNHNLSSISENYSDRSRKQLTHNFNAGFGINVTEKMTLNTAFGYRQSNEDNGVLVNYWDYDAQKILYDQSYRTQADTEYQYNYNGSLSLKQAFKKEGHELSFNFSAEQNVEDEASEVEEYNTFSNQILTQQQRYYNNQNQTRYNTQLDYVLPVKDSKIELGFRNNLQILDTDFKVENLNTETLEWLYNPLFTDDTEYKENITAFYAQYSNKINKISFQAGLRAEISNIDINSKLNNTTVEKDYTDLFPSAFITYSFNDNNQIQIGYSRRVQRPRGRFLIPFVTFSDDRNTFRGNPDIDPFYTNSFELSYITKIGKLNITPTLYYKENQGIWQVYVSKEIMNVNNVEQEIFVSSPINVGDETQYGGSLVFNYKPFVWWRMLGELNVYAYNQKGEYNGINFNGDGVTVSGRYNTTFKLPYQIDLQIQNNIQGNNKTAQGKRYGEYSMNIGLSKDLFGGNGTLSLNIQDVFNSRKRKFETYGEDFNRLMTFQPRQRQINLTFTYRFNQKKSENNREKPSGGDGGDIGF